MSEALPAITVGQTVTMDGVVWNVTIAGAVMCSLEHADGTRCPMPTKRLLQIIAEAAPKLPAAPPIEDAP